ncbi:angiogenic factor with G patch and FHA domains 1 [Perognathus longimembris pacificus]|uniref:angiogenic factor with G patch and FHA domains 1 n=1 Tax=Perognathus longimembris pacificus TaxID=214514 RepID=UPI002018827D|nr:angiogenic factor with G patch and FHA domains 1 [Perognathus longimembris pacificus]
MASEDPSPPPPPPSPSPPASPEPELAQLRRKVEKLERELRSCKRQVREIERLLHHTERLYQSAESNNQELRTQVEELSKILHCGKNEDNKKLDVEVQTENHPPWSISDYYYQTYYNDDSLPNKENELSLQQCQYAEAPSLNSEDQAQIENAYTGTDLTDNVKCGQEDHFTSNSQETASALTAEGEGASLEGSSLAESLRAAAEAAVSQTGFTYDETTGLYFDHSTGFYYDSENQLYYDPSTGIYYYCDVESGRYQFHSRVDLQPYQTSSTRQNKDRKLKKKRRDPDSSTTNEEKDLNSDKKSSSVEYMNCSEAENCASGKKKAKIDFHYKNIPSKFTIAVSENSLESPRKEISNSTSFKDEKIIESDSEPEEGEITDSQTEDSCNEDASSEDNGAIEETEEEDAEKIWPPCIRVIVIRSPVLQTGSLFIITAVNPATIGREKDMEHTLRIPEVGVSKFHAEVYFDHDLQSYVLVDQGSQNGTVVNGKQIIQPKTKSDPYVLEHGDEVKIGETVLSFHIHPGSETCDGCEPGQVRAHLRLDKKDESFVGPSLSKEEKELERRKELKKIRVKYGLQNTDYEDEKALKNPKYKDRAGKRREQVGSEGTFHRDDAPASVHSEITDSNRGRKMLEKMGWKKGEGLGKDGGGMKTPIQLQLRRTHAGLGTGKPSSIDDVHLLQNKNKKNWDKARERFAENFPETKPPKDAPGPMPWVKGTVE